MRIIESCEKKKGTTVADTRPGDVFTEVYEGGRFIRAGPSDLLGDQRQGHAIALGSDGALTWFSNDAPCTIHRDAVLVLEPEGE